MRFQYKATDAWGKIEYGTLTADSREQAIAKLKAEGRFPLLLREINARGWRPRRKRLSKQERLNFTQQLAGLLAARVPLERALAIMGKLQMGEETKRVIGQLRRSLQEGLSFTAALERFPEHFPPLFVNMVRSGEAGGILPQVLHRLAQYQEEEIRLQQHIISSLAYPVLVLFASFSALLLFVAVIIPTFQRVFADMDTPLPLVTKAVMALGLIVMKYWWALLLLLVAAFAAYFRERSRPAGRFRLDRFKLALPYVGSILLKIAMHRMAMALSSLMASGVPLLESLNIASDVVGNEVLAKALKETGNRVREGGTLAGGMAAQSVFPVLVVEMVAVGEESGHLGQMLERVAATYDREVKHSLAVFMSVFEPLLILFLVGVIAVLAMAILLPILNINSLIRL